jgi:heme-degrading monooxygenase HmoA
VPAIQLVANWKTAAGRLRQTSQGTAIVGGIEMHMRIVWGKILPGQWDAFEAAFRKALEIRGEAKGLKNQWLLRDQNDPDAGYSISQWDSDEDMRAFWDSKQRSDAMAVIQPFFVNQFTITNCEVRIALNP